MKNQKGIEVGSHIAKDFETGLNEAFTAYEIGDGAVAKQSDVDLIEAAWVDYVPTLTWTTADPTAPTVVARHKTIGKTVLFMVGIESTDGKDADGLTVITSGSAIGEVQEIKSNAYGDTRVYTKTSWTTQPSIGDSYEIYFTPTLDGTHPLPSYHEAMSYAIT